MNSIDFGGHRSKVYATMGIIDKYGMRRDATPYVRACMCPPRFYLVNTIEA